MKILNYYVFFTSFVFLLVSCDKDSDENNRFGEMYEQLLLHNSKRVYKSEINRVRVNYSSSSRVIIYHFWKMEKFDENGILFLHVYPNDTTLLSPNRKKHGFSNHNILKQQLVTVDSVNYYLALKLPDIELKKVVTGQFNEQRKWSAQFEPVDHWANNLKNTEREFQYKVENILLSKQNTDKLSENKSIKRELLLNTFELKAKKEISLRSKNVHFIIGKPNSFLLIEEPKGKKRDKLLIESKSGNYVEKEYSKIKIDGLTLAVFEINFKTEKPHLRIGNEKIRFLE